MMRGWWQRSRSIVADRRGNALVTFGLMAPLLFLGAGGAIEATTWYAARQKMHAIADAAALAAAREMSLANRDATTVADVARRFAEARFDQFPRNPPTVQVAVAADKTSVVVTLTRAAESMMGGIAPSLGVIEVASGARVSGRANVCVIGLDTSSNKTILLQRSARLTADRCAVYSNSSDTNGVWIQDSAYVRASLICSAGGQKLQGTPDVQPLPTVDCPRVTDPLAGRPEPAAGGCTFTNKIVSGTTEMLLPGIYCGGLQIKGGAVVSLAAGTYVVKGGPLSVTEGSTLKGANVGFFLTPDDSGSKTAEVRFEKSSVIDLTAPKSGDLAGLLLFESARNPATTHRITSDFARVLLGTIYLPKSALYVDADKPVADLSAYTVIVARQLQLDAGPNLQLNTGYNLTDIPVPKGLGPVGGTVTLAK